MLVGSSKAQPSQSTLDLGLWGGFNGYQGDMTYIDRMASMRNSFGLFARYNFNPRYAIRISGLFGSVSGEGEFDDYQWEFSKSFSDLSVVYEFNFWPYLIGSSKNNISTFLTLGLGLSSYSDVSQLEQSIVDGIYTPAVPKTDYSEGESMVAALNIPLGFGFKFNVTKRLGVGSEFVLRKYFDDRFDNLCDPRAFGEKDEEGYNTTMHNNDWTFHLGVFVSYQVFRSDQKCVIYE
ncbi:MAG: DUF6089 family protein [Mangrovibacterium sp.]